MKLGQQNKNEVKFTSPNDLSNSISVSLRQKKLQNNEVENTSHLEETSRSPCILNINLENFIKTKSLFVKLQLFRKDKKNMKPEEEFDPKGYINIKDKNGFEFSLETQKEYAFSIEFLKCNVAKKQDFFILKISFFDNKFTKFTEFIFQSPKIIVCSKLSSTTNKRQLPENEQMEQPEKKKQKNYNDEDIQKMMMDFIQTLEDYNKVKEILEKLKKNFEKSKELENDLSELFQNLVESSNSNDENYTSILDDDYDATHSPDDLLSF